MTRPPIRTLDYACPWCHVRVGARCTDPRGNPVAEHAARRVRAILEEEAKKQMNNHA